MKLLPIFLCNAVLVVAGILIYDQVRSEASSPSFDGGGSDPVDAAALERRLGALERQRVPVLQAQGPTPRLLERLDQLEARLQGLTAARRDAAIPVEGGGPTAQDPVAAPGSSPNRKPTMEDIAAFRTLQAAVRDWERAHRNHITVDKALLGLDIELSEKQRERLVGAYVAFRPRRSAIWAEAKQNGMTSGAGADWKTIVRDVSAVITREFSAQISDFVPASDAERIAGALYGSSK